MLPRWRKEFGAACAPLRVDGLDIRNPDVQEAVRAVRIRRYLQRDGGFVVGRSTTNVDDDGAVGERYVRRFTRTDEPAAEHLGVEPNGAFHVGRHNEIREGYLVWRDAVFGHDCLRTVFRW